MALFARGVGMLPRFKFWSKNGVSQLVLQDGEAFDEDLYVPMLKVLLDRQTEGVPTSLRQLHQITDFEQPEALRLYSRMKETGLVELDHCLHDEFETTITLTRDGIAHLSQVHVG